MGCRRTSPWIGDDEAAVTRSSILSEMGGVRLPTVSGTVRGCAALGYVGSGAIRALEEVLYRETGLGLGLYCWCVRRDEEMTRGEYTSGSWFGCNALCGLGWCC